MNNQVKIFIAVVVLLILGTIGTVLLRGGMAAVKPAEDGKYDGFAQCLKDNGATFYGAFWCPHCQSQKKLFGSSAKLLPYVECSTPDANGQTAVCADAKVSTYPTWEFADGTREIGELSLETLAAKTSCQLPQ